MAQQLFLEEMLSQSIDLHLRNISRIFTRRYDRAYAATGIRSTQVPILLFLMLHGETRLGTLAEELTMDKSTLSRNFMLLEERGLVSRNAIDGRTVGASITAAGEQSLAILTVIWKEVQDEMLKEVGRDSWLGALDVLNRMAGGSVNNSSIHE